MTDTGRTLHSLAMPSSGAATGTPTTTQGCSTSTTTGLTTTTTTLASADPSLLHLDAGHAATEGSILVEGIPQDPAKARQKAKPKTAAAPSGAVVERGKKVLDPCSGSRMFWFNSNNPIAVYGDIRKESHVLCDGRSLEINPDFEMDFRDMPFEDGSFNLVVFDPPHLKHAGADSWTAKKYGVLGTDWENDIRNGFAECFRVLKPNGVLIFKWNEIQIKTKDVLKLAECPPLFGHKSGKRSNTHWLCFMKTTADE